MFLLSSGDITVSKRDVSSFIGIHCLDCADVRFHKSQKCYVEISIDSNLEKYVNIASQNSSLSIGLKDGVYTITKFVVDVYCPMVSNVTIVGSGKFTSSDTLNASNITFCVKGSGSIKASVDCDEFEIDISGSGKVEVSGRSNNADVTISGSGSIAGTDLSIKKAKVSVSGTGQADLRVTDRLKVKVSGSGNVMYRGNPEVDSTVSGTGRVKKIG